MVEGNSAPATFADLFKELRDDGAGKAATLQGEVEIFKKSGASVFACEGGDRSKLTEKLSRGTCTVTTHRLLWLGAGLLMGCDLQDVGAARAGKSRGLFPSHVKEVQLFSPGGSRLLLAVIKFKDRSGREFFEAVEKSMERKDWVVVTASSLLPRPSAAKTVPVFERQVGIAAILKRQEMSHQVVGEIAQETFGDLTSLISKAKEVVAVIDRYSEGLKAKEQQPEANELGDFLLHIGIAAPVTRGGAGGSSEYHQLLAKELAGFLEGQGILSRFGGMMTLADVYSIFNRARGTRLVSPDDLLKVSELLSELSLGMRLRRFDSGVLVIESDRFDSPRMNARLVELADAAGHSGLLLSQAARELKTSTTLCLEHLVQAEEAQLLCRDESLEGIRFFINRFFK